MNGVGEHSSEIGIQCAPHIVKKANFYNVTPYFYSQLSSLSFSRKKLFDLYFKTSKKLLKFLKLRIDVKQLFLSAKIVWWY